MPNLVPNCSLNRVWASNSFLLSTYLSISSGITRRNGQTIPIHQTDTGMEWIPEITVRWNWMIVCDRAQYTTCKMSVNEVTATYCQGVTLQSFTMGWVRWTNLMEMITRYKVVKKAVMSCANKWPCSAAPFHPFHGELLASLLSPRSGWHVELWMSLIQISDRVNPNNISRTTAVDPKSTINSMTIGHLFEKRAFFLLGMRDCISGSRGEERRDSARRGMLKISNHSK